MKNIRLLKIFNFFLDFAPYSPFIILYFAQTTGSFALALGVFSIHSISTCLFEVPTGIFSDRIGRKKTMVLGSLANVIALSFYAWSGSVWILGIGAVFAGLAESLFSGNNEALLYETLKENKQEKDYAAVSGKVASLFQVGLTASALLGSLLSIWSLSFVMWVSVVPQAICLLLSLNIKEPTVHSDKIKTNIFEHLKEALAAFKNNYKLKTLSLTHILDFGVGECMHQFNPTFVAMLWPSWAIGIMRALSNGIAFLGFQFSGNLLKKFSELKLLFGFAILDTILALAALIFPTIFSPIFLTFTSFGFAITVVSKGSLLQKEFTDQQRATMGSLNSFFGNISFAIFAVVLGYIADKSSPREALLLGEIICTATIPLYWNLFKTSPQL